MEKIPEFVTPGLGNRFLDWLRVLRYPEDKRIPLKYWDRLFSVGAITLLSSPFQWYEDMSLWRRLAETDIHPSPVFIVGHWRSGTTFLHNLLSRDEQFGYVDTIQSIFPHSFMTNPLFPYLTKILMPPTRPMDSMALYMKSPQEEEMAMVNYGPYSFYHAWHFPKSIRFFYQRMLKLENLKPGERRKWEKAYLSLLRKTTLHSGGKKLLLKNPANTGRIRILLELFPEGRFIFIYRDPLEVYASTLKLYRNVLPIFQLQEYRFDQVKKDIIWIYKDLMQSYLKQRVLIPENNLYEVSYEHMVNHPIDHLRKIYDQFRLEDFDRAAPVFREYLNLKRIKSFRKGEYDIPEEEKRLVEKEWDFAFGTWQ